MLWACSDDAVSSPTEAAGDPLFSAQAPPGIRGVVSWWPGANTKDAAGPNDGVLVNGALIDRGRIGRGFSLDGSNQYVMVPFHPSLDVAQGSIVFWMRADPSNPMNGCCQGLVTTDHFAVEISGGHDPIVGVNFFVFTTNGGFVHTSDGNGGGAVVSPGEWHHIAGTYDGSRLQLYVNGEPWGNAVLHTGDIVPMSPGSFLAIGSEDGRMGCQGCIGTRYFHGQIDEIAIYDRGLSAAEVRQLFRGGGN